MGSRTKRTPDDGPVDVLIDIDGQRVVVPCSGRAAAESLVEVVAQAAERRSVLRVALDSRTAVVNFDRVARTEVSVMEGVSGAMGIKR